MAVDERTYVSKVASWIDGILAGRPDLPYREARVEEHGTGTRKRADLKILRRPTGVVVLTGEAKMPDQPYGKNVLDGELIEDAFNKASRSGANYYFTWNVNDFALFETHRPGVPFTERIVEVFRGIVCVEDSDDVWSEDNERAIQAFWERLLERLARIEGGLEPIRNLPLDRRFITRLEGALEEPVDLLLDELRRRYSVDRAFKARLDAWMREEQGWEISETPEAIRRNLERASRLTCYALTNRLVFYEVLRRKFSSLLPLVTLPLTERAGEFAGHLRNRFEQAIEASKDYETIFGVTDLGSELPLLSDRAVGPWRRLIAGTEDFDFTRLDYDVIGRMYENLIGPEERRRFGQFFTSPDVVDLINAFCIRPPDTSVLDPSCGAGTFLVRAYARKKALALRDGSIPMHQRLLTELFGVDSAGFPAQLTTINLAVRRLSDEPNYPQVVRSDFFSIRPGLAATRLPVASGGTERDVVIEGLDAVVGNPPYVRQEELGKEYKRQLANLVGQEYKASKPLLSGRSDLYVYFFAHGGAFLKDGGYLGLVTSIGWLDTEYGFRLQEFFLKHFRIVAVLESQVEKWFEDARVTTAVTILQREPDEARRRNNLVRFVQLRQPLAEIYTAALTPAPHDETEQQRQADMDTIRELIEEVAKDQTQQYWRIRVKRQGDLWDAGCKVSLNPEDVEDGDKTLVSRTYKAGKWGQYLRAPDVWFELLDKAAGKLVPLHELAEVRFGFKGGVDKFFCVRDVTDAELKNTPDEARFTTKWGIDKGDTHRVRIVRDGQGGLHLVERKFLEPEFHRLTEATRTVVRKGDVQRLVVNAPVSPAALRKTHLGDYVAFAERQGWNAGATTRSRAKVRAWYDLGLLPKAERAQIFWSKSQQYRHLAPWNDDQLPANCNLYDVWADAGVNSRVLWAVLNSTLVAMSKHQFGRAAGIEGNLKTEVVDVNMMLVPDPRRATPELERRLVAAAEKLASRVLSRMLADEFDMQDRRELDDAVLELLGIGDACQRGSLLHRIYDAMAAQYEATRKRELEAQKDRGRSKRKGTVTAADLANEIWLTALDQLKLLGFPDDFVHSWSGARRLDLPPGPVEVGRALMETGKHLRAGTVRVGGQGGAVLDVGSRGVAEFLGTLAECGIYGSVRVPCEEDCQAGVGAFREYIGELTKEFTRLAAERTRDKRRQTEVRAHLLRKARQWRRGQPS